MKPYSLLGYLRGLETNRKAEFWWDDEIVTETNGTRRFELASEERKTRRPGERDVSQPAPLF